ncbi:hypothetical protein B0H63DRAFT_40571 [Podospora didyma]|uniref:Uncharacterized protein n=1 Tax=Podospora didyma TaxID=330526 RepID=A0AAE0P6I4_9PEZI|nr:hypothetical protein B0H63DRAFT_40571 [Podospora didyma]
MHRPRGEIPLILFLVPVGNLISTGHRQSATYYSNWAATLFTYLGDLRVQSTSSDVSNVFLRTLQPLIIHMLIYSLLTMRLGIQPQDDAWTLI